MPDAAATVTEPITNDDHPLGGIDPAALDADDAPVVTDTVDADAGDDKVDPPATDTETPPEPAEPEKTPVEAKDAPPEPKVEEKPKPPVEDKPAEPDPKAVEAQQKALADFHAWDTDFAKLPATLAELQAKPEETYENAGKLIGALATAVKGLAYARQAINEQAAKISALETGRAQETYWEGFQRQTPEVPIAKAKDIWSEELIKARGSYKDETAAQAVATERFKDRIAIVKGQAKSKPAPVAPPAKTAPAKPSGKPASPVTKGGGNVVPKAGSVHQPKPPSPTPEDEFATAVGAGGIEALLERA